MNKFLLVLFSISSYTLFCQEKKVGIYFSGSPDLYFYSSSNEDYEGKSLLKYTVGTGFRFDPNGKLSFKAGLTFSTKAYIKKYHWLSVDQLQYDPAIPLETNLNLSYLSIPIQASYYFLNKKIVSIYSTAIFSTGILLRNNEKSIFGDQTKRETTFLSTYYSSLSLSSGIGIGVGFNLTKKLSLAIEPYCLYWINKDNKMMLNSLFSGASLSLYIFI